MTADCHSPSIRRPRNLSEPPDRLLKTLARPPNGGCDREALVGESRPFGTSGIRKVLRTCPVFSDQHFRHDALPTSLRASYPARASLSLNGRLIRTYPVVVAYLAPLKYVVVRTLLTATREDPMPKAATLIALLLASPILTAADRYPAANLLIEPAALATGGAADKFLILDARSREAYLKGHVPGAVWVDHADWAKAFGDGQDADGWAKRIGELGIRGDRPVVVYDDAKTKDAARIWWILRYWGVPDVRLLNGGWKAWTADNHPTDRVVVDPKPVTFRATAAPERLATKSELLDSLSPRSLQIVDARTEGEHCGTDGLKNQRAGAVPGAKHLEWIDLIDPTTHRFKSSNDLRSLYRDAGIDLTKPTATHCQSGGRAAVMAFGLELMGAKNVSNYYRSWAEWGNADDTPVEKPKVQPPKKDR